MTRTQEGTGTPDECSSGLLVPSFVPVFCAILAQLILHCSSVQVPANTDVTTEVRNLSARANAQIVLFRDEWRKRVPEAKNAPVLGNAERLDYTAHCSGPRLCNPFSPHTADSIARRLCKDGKD